jgi:itaconate CoA-transferase
LAAEGLPLAGLRVVAWEHAVAAPLATRHLADLGADVVKVERPGRGDFARDYDSVVNGLSAHFVWLNRGKRSVVLDLRDDSGRRAFELLLERADVPRAAQTQSALDRLRDLWLRSGRSAPRPQSLRSALAR